MANRKQDISKFLDDIRLSNMALIAGLTNYCSLDEYVHLVREKDGLRIWTDALQQALIEHQVVIIPSAEEPYYIDASLRMPSNRHIEAAYDAVIRLTADTEVLMLRNENTMDGTHMPFSDEFANNNISINGGRWEESNTCRKGYGRTGKYDAERSFYGVSTCMLFNNIENLTLTNMVFANAAAFCVQLGNAKNVVIENITFESCYADGLHINGNVENVLVRNISGEVGDDLVALNTYDWQNSSVNFGPGKCIMCENIVSADSGKYKSMRLEQGIYTYEDGSQVDCSLTDTLIKTVRGVHTFKMYYQTPAYDIGTAPEKGAPGSMDGIHFEDIEIDLSRPVDSFDAYENSDPVRGWFGAFEMGSNIGFVSFENIRITMHQDKYPISRMIVVGPKSIRIKDREVFDPYVSNSVECIFLKDITVNGEPMKRHAELIHITRFDDVNGDGNSTGKGSLGKIIVLP